jgi:hypothetical protein
MEGGQKRWWRNPYIVVPSAAVIIAAVLAAVIPLLLIRGGGRTPEVGNVTSLEIVAAGQQLDILGKNLDLVSEVWLSKGPNVSIRVFLIPANELRLTVTIPRGVQLGDYNLEFRTKNGSTAAVVQTKVVPGLSLAPIPTPTPRPIPTLTPTPTPVRVVVQVPTPTPTPMATPVPIRTALSTRFNPTIVNLVKNGDSAVITIITVNGEAGVDGVQINVQHPPEFAVTNPQCVGIFDGAIFLEPTAITGGTLIGCYFRIGDVRGTTGIVMTFVLARAGVGNPTITFGLTGAFATMFSDVGSSVGPGTTNTLQVTAE